MQVGRRGTHLVQYPNDTEVVHVRSFDAPINVVFTVLTEPAHIARWGATGGDVMTTCEADLHVGGDYHWVFVTPDGTECSFRGTYLEVDPPRRVVSTWHFEGWPDAWAIATDTLIEVDGVTTLTMRLTFEDAAGAANMRRGHERARATGTDNGQGASFDAMEDVLTELLLASGRLDHGAQAT
jgi:uncharacterized protein YndB with AHSA1/START domain